MKFLVYIFLFISLLFFSCGKNQINEGIKVIHESTYGAVEKFGKIEKNDFIDSVISLYNEKGKLIEEIYSSYKYLYKYDATANIFERTKYNKNAVICEKETYTYDSNGNLNEQTSYTEDKSKEPKKTKEDFFKEFLGSGDTVDNAHTKVDEKETVNTKIELILNSKYISKYNENNKIIEHNWYNSDGTVRNKWIYKYEKDEVIEISYNSNGIMTQKSESFYDKSDKITKTYIYSAQAILDKNAEPLLSAEIKYLYDDYGNIIEESSSLNDALLYKNTYKYEYDSKLNWIKQDVFEDGKPTITKERKIIYY